ncbi:MBL fold metallo-hydrolase [Nocardioides bigeumensis]|uniref:Metallo-beta-lactamase domain-containing protein n=1 Tax=Nocardioides bigeumensis TaxID=433657 RepID=A0ABN2YUT4_9ACTN
MRMVHVVDVGDGACAILRPWPDHGLGPATVIDCGVWRARAKTAADTLLGALDGDLSEVESFVVSHFDWDHWGGLRNLEHFPTALNTLYSATLFYPSMPWRVPAALYALMGPQTGTGSAALDLSNSMHPLLRRGETLTLQPLHTGKGTIRLAGERFDVLWPPQFIDRVFSRRLDGAVKAVEDLAEDLEAAGYPTLKRNLDDARSGAATLADGVEADDGAPPDLGMRIAGDSEAAQFPHEDLDWLDTDGGDDLPLEEIDAEEALGARLEHEDDDADPDDPDLHQVLGTLPEGFTDRHRRVLRRIRAANNDLSLVLASRSGRLVAFGDISGFALRRVLISPRLAGRRFEVMLLPHHGTHPLPDGMPAARWCVAQGGVHHLPRWQANHPLPHPDAHVCWNTAERGSLFPGW